MAVMFEKQAVIRRSFGVILAAPTELVDDDFVLAILSVTSGSPDGLTTAHRFEFRYTIDLSTCSLAPIPGFPDSDKIYTSDRLWPFFECRIPPSTRDDIKDLINILGINKDDPYAMLSAFGLKAIKDPYVLVPFA